LHLQGGVVFPHHMGMGWPGEMLRFELQDLILSVSSPSEMGKQNKGTRAQLPRIEANQMG
jgi:hypothetical protein